MADIVKSSDLNPCTQCGACSVAPDITSLDKPAGQACIHLMPDNRCQIYDRCPLVCRQSQADEQCVEIDAPTREERVKRFQAVFGLFEEKIG